MNDAGPSLFVKICGLRTERDVAAAVGAGADAVGFVFAESPRRVGADVAAELVRGVPGRVLTVGVFRDQPLEEVRALARGSGVRAVQLHGGEGRSDYAALAAEGWTLIRGAGVREGRVPSHGEMGEDILLLDAPVPGSGTSWDWTSVDGFGPGERWLLAGGLNAGNVGAAVAAARPWGVDVSSGVEVSRGVKEPALIAEFVRAARSAG
ncbi:phosphoribosylanthranilate isomerase [Marinactinospora rubrisoli]|uniref:N-(5'-phosphoribosyl)anthranilate isomerase n=1 Tax=Marinactinospora rubrisoli TaxID=2715399 RepID=A0ABW2K9K8_9ACTN